MRIGVLDRAHGAWAPAEIGVRPLSFETEQVAGLALGLAASHEVTVFHRTDRPFEAGNLRSVRSVGMRTEALRGLDVLLAVEAWDPAAIASFRKIVRTVLWTPAGDPAIAEIPADGWAFPSEWALQRALRRAAIPDERTALWRPTVLPAFEAPIGDPSARDRVAGGPELSRLWPAIRAMIPGIRGITLGGPPGDGLDAAGTAPAERLAALRRTAIWVEAPESEPAASRSIVEALVAGCEVVAVQRGAIWEECCGFGRFVGPPLHDADARLVQRIARSWADPRRPARMAAAAAWGVTRSRDARAAEVTRDLAALSRGRPG